MVLQLWFGGASKGSCWTVDGEAKEEAEEQGTRQAEAIGGVGQGVPGLGDLVDELGELLVEDGCYDFCIECGIGPDGKWDISVICVSLPLVSSPSRPRRQVRLVLLIHLFPHALCPCLDQAA